VAGIDSIWATSGVCAGAGAKRLNKVLIDKTNKPLETPKKMLKAIPRTNRKRYGLR